jgi:hypothetical protein
MINFKTVLFSIKTIFSNIFGSLNSEIKSSRNIQKTKQKDLNNTKILNMQNSKIALNTINNNPEFNREVRINGSFGGNGDKLHFQNISIINNSNQTIYYEYLKLFNQDRLKRKIVIHANESSSLSAINNLEYPINKKMPDILVYFYTKDFTNNTEIHYKLTRKLKFTSRNTDNKLCPHLSDEDPVVTKLS